MGIRILREGKQAVMYCSTTEWAFGPVFSDSDTRDADERIEAFLRWLKVDARHFPDLTLSKKYAEWCAQEEAQWAAEELVEKLRREIEG